MNLFRILGNLLGKRKQKKEVCGQHTQATEQPHESTDKCKIRMFRRSDIDPRNKGIIRRPWKVSIILHVYFVRHAEPRETWKSREKGISRVSEVWLWLACGKKTSKSIPETATL